MAWWLFGLIRVSFGFLLYLDDRFTSSLPVVGNALRRVPGGSRNGLRAVPLLSVALPLPPNATVGVPCSAGSGGELTKQAASLSYGRIFRAGVRGNESSSL